MTPTPLVLAVCLGLTGSGPDTPPPAEKAFVLVVVGAPGEAEYETAFREAAGRWQAAAGKASAECRTLGLTPSDKVSDRDRLKAALDGLTTPSTEPLWLVLLGHGTYDGRDARFNLR